MLVLASSSFSQKLRGVVKDQAGQPIPFVNIYVKDQNSGTTTDFDGKYLMHLNQGSYQMVYNCMGFESKTIIVQVGKDDIVKNIILNTSAVEIEEVNVKAKRRDPAYEIMENARKRKEKYLKQLEALSCDVYIKAVEYEMLSEKEKAKREKNKLKQEAKRAKKVKNESDSLKIDSINNKFKPRKAGIGDYMNMVESKSVFHYQYPNNRKEIISAYNKLGNPEMLFYTSCNDGEFNFYNNMVNIPDLGETPYLSPLSPVAVLSYKFRLDSTDYSTGTAIYKIRVIPRRKGVALFEGDIFIREESFNITKVDFALNKGSMVKYDSLGIRQSYFLLNDSIWQLESQRFKYKVKFSGGSVNRGYTDVKYSNYIINPEFKKKFFKNEISVTEDEAYDRDSTYWSEVREKPLSEDEQSLIAYEDSVYEATHTKEYLDSVDAERNKLTLLKLGIYGMEHYNREKEITWYYAPLIAIFNPLGVDGVRVGWATGMSKKWKNKKYFFGYPYVNYGLTNGDIKGYFESNFTYAPKKFANLHFTFGRDFRTVAPLFTIDGYFGRNNYVDETYINAGHSFEISNGIYLYTGVDFSKRMSLVGYEFKSLWDFFVTPVEPVDFEPYNLAVLNISLKIRPEQKYVTKPHEKIVVGSRYPDFEIRYRKGVPGLFGGVLDYDKLELGIDGTIKAGMIGTSKISTTIGTFLNTNKMFPVDQKIYGRSDQVFYSNPLRSFQTLDSTYYTTKTYAEIHYVHHFSGALLNKFPVTKQLRIESMGGGSVLFSQEHSFQHVELFGGVERVFRIRNSRLKFGVYYVVGGNLDGTLSHRIKIGVNDYNPYKNTWTY